MTDITRKRGDTYGIEFAITDSSGTAIDVTGYTFLMTVDTSKAPTNSDNNVFQLTGTITDAAAGLVEFAPTALQADMTPGTYFFDCQMTDDTGRIRTIDSGKFKIVQDITK